MNLPDYPMTRHLQRYEYVGEQGYVDGKNVLDVDCGVGGGTTVLLFFAKAVVGLDPILADLADSEDGMITVPAYTFPGRERGELHWYPKRWEDINEHKTALDVVVAMELIEHLDNPAGFLTKMAAIADHLFLSTPLAEKTAPTDNPCHVVEYSHKDLVEMVSQHYEILDVKYQTGDLRIVDSASPNGSSIKPGHVVQMLWCKRKSTPETQKEPR